MSDAVTVRLRHGSSFLPGTFRYYSRVPCVGELLDVGGDGHRTWRVTQVMHGPNSEVTAWVEPVESPEQG